MADRLADLLHAAARGTPPPPNLATKLLPRPAGPVSAVLGFTGHHVVAADVDQDWFDAHRDQRDFGSVMRAPFLAALGERIGARVGHLDVVLVAPAERSDQVESADALAGLSELDPSGSASDRVRRALAYRTDVRAFATADGAGVVLVGCGLAGRWEVAFEVAPSARGRGLGRQLAAAATTLVPAGDPLIAQVSPGNVASLRVLLAAGYRPIGSEVLLLHPTR